MKDLGEANRILGMNIMRKLENGELFLFQSSYLKKVVKRFKMFDDKSVNASLNYHTKFVIIQYPQIGD